MDRVVKLGNFWLAYALLGLLFLGWSIAAISYELLFGVLSATVGLLFIAMAILMRRWLNRRWVWLLGYCCWFSLILIGLVMLGFSLMPIDDAVSQGMSVMLGLPLTMGLILISTLAAIQWNKLQLNA